MEDEPRNRASDRVHDSIPADWADPVTMRRHWYDSHSEDFVRVDRRRLVGQPDANRDEHLALQLMWFELGDPIFAVETVAVRGERLALMLASIGYDGGSQRHALTVVLMDPEIRRTTMNVHFDPDDLEGALAELDRLHAEIGD